MNMDTQVSEYCFRLFWIYTNLWMWLGLPGGSDGKESACNAGDPGSVPGSGGSPGEGNGNPLQYSCLENSMDRGSWWATVFGLQSQTRLSDYHYYYCKCDHWLTGLLHLSFWGTSTLLPTAAAPLYIPTSRAWGFQLHHILTNTCYFPFSNYSHPNKCTMSFFNATPLILMCNQESKKKKSMRVKLNFSLELNGTNEPPLKGWVWGVN